MLPCWSPKNLNFDVFGRGDVFFDKHRVVAEGGECFALGAFQLFVKFGFGIDHAHALAAATRRGLDENRVADLRGDLFGGGAVGDGRVHAGHEGHVHAAGGLFGRNFPAHHLHAFGRGADENQPRLPDFAGKPGVFAQKPVAGVNGVHAALLADLYDFIAEQVRLVGRRRPHAHGLVGVADVEGLAVGFAENGHGGDAHFAGGAHHAQGDFTAVGDEDFFDFGHK